MRSLRGIRSVPKEWLPPPEVRQARVERFSDLLGPVAVETNALYYGDNLNICGTSSVLPAYPQAEPVDNASPGQVGHVRVTFLRGTSSVASTGSP